MKSHLLLFLVLFLALSSTTRAQSYAVYDEVNGSYYHIPHAARDLDTAWAELKKATISIENDTQKERYANALYSVGAALKMLNRKEETRKYWHQVERYCTDTLQSKQSAAYQKTLIALARIQENGENGRSYIQQFLALTKGKEDFSRIEYEKVALFYKEMEKIDSAKYYIGKHLHEIDAMEKNNPVEYAFRLNSLATVYEINGEDERADSLYKTIIVRLKKAWQSEINYEWRHFLPNYIGFLTRIKDTNRIQQALNQFEQVIKGKETIGVLNQIGLGYEALGNMQLAREYFLESIKVGKKEYATQQHACSFQNLGRTYFATNLDTALIYTLKGKQLIIKDQTTAQIFEEVKVSNEETKKFYFFIYTNTSSIYLALNNYDKALEEAEVAYKIGKQMLVKGNEEILRACLGILMKCYSFKKDYVHFAEILKFMIYEIRPSEINRVLPFIGKTERLSRLSFEQVISLPLLAQQHKFIPESGGLLYDYMLLIKSKQLDWSVLDLLALQQNKDPRVSNLYEKILDYRIKIVNLKNISKLQQDTLVQLETNLTQQLNIRIPRQVRWQDIQRKLKPHELAIEFLTINHYDILTQKFKDSVSYYAVLMTYNMAQPQILYLCSQEQLDRLLKNGKERDFYALPKTYNLLWQKIAAYTKDIHTIWYAPASDFGKIDFGAISAPNGQKLLERYQFNQLMTTRSIVDAKNEINILKPPINVLLIGGNDYGPVDQDSPPYKGALTRQAKDDFFLFLPNSKQEVERLHQLNIQNGNPSQLLTQREGTEAHFKALLYHRQSPDVLVLSTHAYYDTVSISHPNAPYDPLYHSGVVFADANRLSEKKNTSIAANDGILTGFEIAQLNLLGTKLVILSACETAKGNTQNKTEGLYSLQRAFKLAGTQYILAYNEVIYDETAEEFVTLFYQNLVTKKLAINIAFRLTQQQFNNRYPNDLSWTHWSLIY